VTAKKTRRKTLIKLDRIDLAIDMSPSGLLETRTSLENALAASEGGSVAQLRLNACDLNAIYIYMPLARVKKLLAQLAEPSSK
jgi:hypothetical protein